jgi:TetR/AcrR family transcriptional repressor of nem operon
MPRPSRSRNRILDSAHQLFWLHGYHAASLDEILRDARASTGSFYYHFHSKAHILLSLLDEYIRGFQPSVIAPACSQSSDPVERVMFVLTHYRGNLIKTNFRCGCLLGKLALEIPENQLLQKISACFDTWTAVLENSLHDARPPLPQNVDVKSLSRFVLATMEGAAMLCRASGSIEPYDAAMLHLRSYLQQLATTQQPAPQPDETSPPTVL